MIREGGGGEGKESKGGGDRKDGSPPASPCYQCLNLPSV
jgi:hypothetical protein